MKVKIIKTGAIESYNDSYAARLIEQGVAVQVEPQKVEKKAADKATDKAADKAAASK